MYIRYGGTEHYIQDRGFKIEVGPGHSTYIRLRIFFEEYPHTDDYKRFMETVSRWNKKCINGDYSEKYDLLSFNTYFKYLMPIAEVDFDIAKTEVLVIDKLFGEIEETFKNGYIGAKITKAYIGFCFANEWY